MDIKDSEEKIDIKDSEFWVNYFALKLLLPKKIVKMVALQRKRVRLSDRHPWGHRLKVNLPTLWEKDWKNRKLKSAFEKAGNPCLGGGVNGDPVQAANALLFVLTRLNSEQFVADIFSKNQRQVRYLRQEFEKKMRGEEKPFQFLTKPKTLLNENWTEQELKTLIGCNFLRNRAAENILSKISLSNNSEEISEKMLSYLRFFFFYPQLPPRKPKTTQEDLKISSLEIVKTQQIPTKLERTRNKKRAIKTTETWMIKKGITNDRHQMINLKKICRKYGFSKEAIREIVWKYDGEHNVGKSGNYGSRFNRYK